MRRPRSDRSQPREPAELAALADGSIPSGRRAALEEQVAASPELAERLAEQQRALLLTREAAGQVDAPPSLRANLDARSRPRRARTPRLAAAVVVTVALAAGIVAAVLTSGSSGEQFHAALGPTGLVPGAQGRAILTRTTSGWRIELDASGLPRLDDGRFYEAWLKNDDGVLVPIGTFNEGRKVTLWAGVSPEHFTTLSVTRERADGDQTSSGEKVLVGAVETGSR
jgi:Anti-sigma-K factor rskA, C-terminal